MARLAVFPKGFFDQLIDGRMSLFRWLDLAAELDVDGVELYPKFFAGFEPAYVSKVSNRLRNLGLEMPMLCHSPDFTQPDPNARAREVRRTLDMIRLTADLGGGYCRVLSGQRRAGVSEADGLDWVTKCIEAVLPDAERAGIVLTLENHYKDGTWTQPEFAQRMPLFLELLERIPSSHLKVQYDPSNAVVAGDDPYALLEAVAGRVATAHASDRYLAGGTLADLRHVEADPHLGYAPLLRHGVIGEGENDFDRIFGTLAAAGFNGWVSIEDGEGETEALGMANLKKSAAFCRAKMAAHFPAYSHPRQTKRPD